MASCIGSDKSTQEFYPAKETAKLTAQKTMYARCANAATSW